MSGPDGQQPFTAFAGNGGKVPGATYRCRPFLAAGVNSAPSPKADTFPEVC